jgi:hypothetical protein
MLIKKRECGIYHTLLRKGDMPTLGRHIDEPYHRQETLLSQR